MDDILREWLLSDPSQTTTRARILLVGLAAALVLPTIAMAIYLWRLGNRIVNERRFPPDGVRMIRKVPIVRGKPALLRGRIFQACAAVIGMAAVVMALMLGRLAALL
jgi:hypothetical protein